MYTHTHTYIYVYIYIYIYGVHVNIYIIYMYTIDNGGRPLHEGHKAKNRTGLGNVWHNEQNMEVKQYIITTATKVKLYGTFVIPVMMYGSECWCLRKEDERRILVEEMSWLRRILGRSRRDRIQNEVTRKELQDSRSYW